MQFFSPLLYTYICTHIFNIEKNNTILLTIPSMIKCCLLRMIFRLNSLKTISNLRRDKHFCFMTVKKKLQ